MATKVKDSRQHIIDVTNRLVYHRGYSATSFADIANAAGIPKGNFYYHFRTKDDILKAVIGQRCVGIEAMLREWQEGSTTPLARLKRFVQMLRNSERDLSRYGCPMGSLNTELGKGQPKLQAAARAMFDQFSDWLAAQFAALGFDAAEARHLALHLLGRAQGISIMTHVYGDKDFLHREIDALDAWLETLHPGEAQV